MKRCRRLYRWQWGNNPDEDIFDARSDLATYVLAEKLTTLDPNLRNNHGAFWQSLGHEFIHAFFKHTGEDKEGEQVALRYEDHAGQLLHDLFTSRILKEAPKCAGSSPRKSSRRS